MNFIFLTKLFYLVNIRVYIRTLFIVRLPQMLIRGLRVANAVLTSEENLVNLQRFSYMKMQFVEAGTRADFEKLNNL